ncbi:MAG: hypothetical protein RIK87_13670 [Fuerstiella sp.]
MTIQRLVLSGLAAMLAVPTADAQCYRSRPQVLHHSHHGHHGHRDPHYSWRPHFDSTYIRTTHAQTVEVPPVPSAVTFGAYSHVDELAYRLEVLMNELCLDLYYNYSHNHDFHATYAEAYSLYQTASFIHAAEHNADRETAKSQLAGADALFHHIQDDVRGWTRIQRRQIGTLGIMTKLDMAEDTLHHLMTDVGVVVAPGREEPPVPQSLSAAPNPIRIP